MFPIKLMAIKAEAEFHEALTIGNEGVSGKLSRQFFEDHPWLICRKSRSASHKMWIR